MSRASTEQDKFSKEFQAAVANSTVFTEAQVRTMLTWFLQNANVHEMDAALSTVSMDKFDLFWYNKHMDTQYTIKQHREFAAFAKRHELHFNNIAEFNSAIRQYFMV